MIFEHYMTASWKTKAHRYIAARRSSFLGLLVARGIKRLAGHLEARLWRHPLSAREANHGMWKTQDHQWSKRGDACKTAVGIVIGKERDRRKGSLSAQRPVFSGRFYHCVSDRSEVHILPRNESV